MSVEELNEGHKSNLAALRERIAQNTKSFSDDIKLTKNEVLEVPEITIEPTNTFSIERHKQLCNKIDIEYHNYLVSKGEFEVISSTLATRLRQMSKTYEELIAEGVRPRI